MGHVVSYFQGESGFHPSKELKETFREEAEVIGDCDEP